MKKIGLILVVFSFLVGCASTGPSPESSANIGDYAPDFSLFDVSGNEVRLGAFKGKKKVVLIFYDSYYWQYSLKQLGGLQERFSEIERLNAQIIAISTGGDQQDEELTKRSLGITYILIPKPNRKVVEDFGLVSGASRAAYATFIIDKKGRIRYKSVNDSFNLTFPPLILKELQGI